METITASVEEVSLSENTPDEQRKSTDNDADIHYNYKKSNSKNAQIIVRVIHPGSRVTKENNRITNNHTTSATETKTPTKEFEANTREGGSGAAFQPTCDPARTVCPKDSRLRGPEGARGEGNNLSQAKTAKPRQGGVHCVARERAKAEVPDQEPQ